MKIMKRILIVVLLIITSAGLFAQSDSVQIPPNAILKNFKPFPTPRTNYRPGTVYRVDKNGTVYFVEDVKAIGSFTSEEGTLSGRIYLTKEQLLSTLNIESNAAFVPVEIEIKDAAREFNEQSAIDRVMWEGEKAELLVVDETSKYYIIRETVSTSEITYRFSEKSYELIVSGKGTLKKTVPRGDDVIDFPYYVTKKFKDPLRIFYKDQEIGLEPYGKK